MAITTRDELIAALANARQAVIDKASLANAVAGRHYSLWRATGLPAQGAIPAAAAVCTNTLTGALNHAPVAAPETNYLALLMLANSLATTGLEIHDRLCHLGGLVGNVATLQTTNLPLGLAGVAAERIGPTDCSELQWWLEWYTDTGSTAVTATVNVTYDDDTSSNVAISLSATSRAAGLYAIQPAAGKKGIKQVNSVQLSATTGTAGNFGVTCTRFRAGAFSVVANKPESFDWAALGLPQIGLDACLALLMLCSTTTTGNVKGIARFVAG